MELSYVVLIGIALAMDACGVALSIGFNCQVKLENKVKFALSFAFFQFLFAYTGSFLGKIINDKVIQLPTLIGGIAIFIVGAMMIKEGMEEKEECILIKPGMYIVLGISVSIDALVVGITALQSRGDYILQDGILIGLITLVLVTGAFLLTKFLSRFPMISKYSDYLGGVILIIFSLKMIFF